MTRLRQRMRDQPERRNYSQNTIYTYLHAVEDFSKYFHRSPDRLGPDHIRQYQAYLFRERKLQAGTITCCTAALRFLYVQDFATPISPRAHPISQASPAADTRLSPAGLNFATKPQRDSVHDDRNAPASSAHSPVHPSSAHQRPR